MLAKGQDNYKLLLGNLCSKELSLIGHITQAVMVMTCYLYQNWEEPEGIRYEISYGKEVIDWSLRFRSFAGHRNTCRLLKQNSICSSSSLASRHCRAGLSHAAAVRLEHGLFHLDDAATRMVSQLAL